MDWSEFYFEVPMLFINVLDLAIGSVQSMGLGINVDFKNVGGDELNIVHGAKTTAFLPGKMDLESG